MSLCEKSRMPNTRTGEAQVVARHKHHAAICAGPGPQRRLKTGCKGYYLQALSKCAMASQSPCNTGDRNMSMVLVGARDKQAGGHSRGHRAHGGASAATPQLLPINARCSLATRRLWYTRGRSNQATRGLNATTVPPSIAEAILDRRPLRQRRHTQVWPS